MISPKVLTVIRTRILPIVSAMNPPDIFKIVLLGLTQILFIGLAKDFFRNLSRDLMLELLQEFLPCFCYKCIKGSLPLFLLVILQKFPLWYRNSSYNSSRNSSEDSCLNAFGNTSRISCRDFYRNPSRNSRGILLVILRTFSQKFFKQCSQQFLKEFPQEFLQKSR